MLQGNELKTGIGMTSIVFIHQSAELYGSDRTLLTLLSGIDRSVYNPVVILPGEGPLKTELEKLGIEVVIAPVLKLYRDIFKPKNMLLFIKDIQKSFRIINRLHKKHNFQLVYSNTLAVLLGMLFAKKNGIKHIWHVHEIIVHPKVIASLFPRLLKNADKIICNSKATRDNLVKRVKALQEKCVVIYNGLDVDSTEKVSDDLTYRQELGFSEKDIIITLVGRISRLKGHKLLLSAYLQHLSSNSNIKLLFVGSPVPGQEHYLDQVEEIIAKNNLEAKVKVLPFTKDLSNVWNITDIAAVPSTEAESFGLTALEAMLRHKPVVAANHGGLTEIVVHKETGLLFEPCNEDALASALKELISDATLREELGNKGYDIAVQVFSNEQYVKKIVSLF